MLNSYGYVNRSDKKNQYYIHRLMASFNEYHIDTIVYEILIVCTRLFLVEGKMCKKFAISKCKGLNTTKKRNFVKML